MKLGFGKSMVAALTTIAIALFLLSMGASPASAQQRIESVFNGHRIIYPASSIPHAGGRHTNYFFVDSDKPQSGPPSGVESPGSLACVYQLVSGPAGCPEIGRAHV